MRSSCICFFSASTEDFMILPSPFVAPVQIDSLMDLVVFVATNVYQVTDVQLATLMLVKLLGQESIESLVYK